MLKEGYKAPDFSVLDDRGNPFKLSENLGKKKLVLFFYPKADTPGCTKEACAFRDASKKIEAKGATVIGISMDAVEKQAKFRDKYDLNMPLLSDAKKQIVSAYGVYKEKNMYGKKVMGIERSTFLIDAAGVLRNEWRKIKVPGHVDEVLAAVKALGKA